jgi:hypothetical protein
MLDHTRLVQESSATKIGFVSFLILGVVLISAAAFVRGDFVLLTLGATFVAMGGGFGAFVKTAHARIDTVVRTVEAGGRFIFSKTKVIPFDDIAGATVASFRDPELPDLHAPMLRLRDGRVVLIPVRSPSEWEVRKWVETLNLSLNRGATFDEVDATIDDDRWIDEAITRRHAERRSEGRVLPRSLSGDAARHPLRDPWSCCRAFPGPAQGRGWTGMTANGVMWKVTPCAPKRTFGASRSTLAIECRATGALSSEAPHEVHLRRTGATTSPMPARMSATPIAKAAPNRSPNIAEPTRMPMIGCRY